ncbi:hypothetical protein SERLA73DRAFT_175015 [Serpula lacrymans var. lacrymans S7.3]|uniref:Peptidase A1 domain-containing protein n=2 Tax=Serpula lacrymans var. lacrymans TaxID=341189 RepID=F8PJU8_SERL3|nr:uncharacterized protein SERLADRAFT_456788 [Serpula lacrymans var. lacrymans S7.9]EGO03508.1 hypothetical protein SERLA73DRAFT_175015 [Serpula lacrymans var. lacrymans S7.3]EGO29259.1 hypothetical protein SERLADRAFT_456788 [Serpula lacrymans var. lacrymans S7.9]
MQLPIVALLALLPFFVAANPVQHSPSAGIKLPLVKKSNLVHPKGPVDTDALRAHILSLERKYQRGFDAFERNTGARHPLAPVLSTVVSKRGSGAVPLTDENAQLWQGSIKVGTPAKQFIVDFDTGSSDLFLPGPNCGSTCQGHTIYKPSSSSTAKDLQKTFKLTYGDNSSVSGEQYTDTVLIAGLIATKQTLGVAKQYSNGFNIATFSPDGLMGMGFPAISDYNANPVFQTLVEEGVTTQPVFAFKLADNGAELMIGGVNKKLYTGAFTYVPVIIEGYWQVNMDAITLNGKEVFGEVEAIIDTGTTLIVGHPNDVQKFYSGIAGAKSRSDVSPGVWTIPCSAQPNVTLTFGLKAFPISHSTFVVGQVESGSSDCIAAVMSSPSASEFWIVGDAFLQNTYTVFDAGLSRVGFAQLA